MIFSLQKTFLAVRVMLYGCGLLFYIRKLVFFLFFLFMTGKKSPLGIISFNCFLCYRIFYLTDQSIIMLKRIILSRFVLFSLHQTPRYWRLQRVFFQIRLNCLMAHLIFHNKFLISNLKIEQIIALPSISRMNCRNIFNIS